MKPGQKRWLLRLAIPLLVGGAVLAWSARDRTAQPLTIENRSGQPIPVLRLTVAGETATFEAVAPGASVSAPAEGPCVVEGALADGTRIHVQPGQPEPSGRRRALVILPGGVIVPRPRDAR